MQVEFALKSLQQFMPSSYQLPKEQAVGKGMGRGRATATSFFDPSTGVSGPNE